MSQGRNQCGAELRVQQHCRAGQPGPSSSAAWLWPFAPKKPVGRLTFSSSKPALSLFVCLSPLDKGNALTSGSGANSQSTGHPWWMHLDVFWTWKMCFGQRAAGAPGRSSRPEVHQQTRQNCIMLLGWEDAAVKAKSPSAGARQRFLWLSQYFNLF